MGDLMEKKEGLWSSLGFWGQLATVVGGVAVLVYLIWKYIKGRREESVRDELLREYGVADIVRINQEHSAKELDGIRQRQIFEERLRWSELGRKHYAKFIMGVLAFSVLLCYIIGFDFPGWLSRSFSRRVTSSFLLFCCLLGCVNFFDWGRFFLLTGIVSHIPEDEEKKKIKAAQDRILKDVKILLETEGAMSAEDIRDALRLGMTPTEVGKLLASTVSGFVRVRREKKREWFTDNMIKQRELDEAQKDNTGAEA